MVRHGPHGAALALVGDGPARAALTELADDTVVFAGAVPDVRDWYDAASFVVQPSRWEGASLATREAMASGLGVVASDVHGAREAVAPGCGVVVPPDDVVALAEALAHRLADAQLSACEGLRARERAVSEFALSRMVQQVQEMYRELLTCS